MPSIESQKLLYHLSSVDNALSIFLNGLLSRSRIDGFVDVADNDILEKRKSQSLQDYVPFHFFAKNPFDYSVQHNNDGDFMLITVRRMLAEQNNWQVICRHPLANGVELYDYKEGVGRINWPLMNQRDYADAACKSVCMAECLSPNSVPASNFFKIYVDSDEAEQRVLEAAKTANITINVDVNENMFVRVNA